MSERKPVGIIQHFCRVYSRYIVNVAWIAIGVWRLIGFPDSTLGPGRPGKLEGVGAGQAIRVQTVLPYHILEVRFSFFFHNSFIEV